MDANTDLQNSVQSPQQLEAREQADDRVLDVPPSAPPPTNTNTGAPSLRPPVNDDDNDAAEEKKRRNKELTALGRTFGHIPNVPIFATWDKRRGCCEDAVHRNPLTGICGNGRLGVYSIVLSSFYEDDEDGGDIIIYTGSGGREKWSNATPPRRLHFGPQTKDQSWDDPPNKAIIISFLTGNPVRVVRSWKLTSKYAPVTGYRYDGLYKITAYWTATGQKGKNICRCRLERLPDQPPIPLRQITIRASRRRRKERLVSESHLTCNPSTFPLPGNQGESEGLSNHSQEWTPPDTAPQSNCTTDGVDHFDEKEDQQPLPSQHQSTLNPDTLPRYRWDSRRKQLVQVPSSKENPDSAERCEETRGDEDGALTLVPSEGGNREVDMITEPVETRHFSDGITRGVTAD